MWNGIRRQIVCGMIPGIPGAHSQGRTVDELHENLKEMITLCVEEYQGQP